MLKASILIAIGIFCAGTAWCEEGDIALQTSGTDIKNIESLQRGARNFMNYCSGLPLAQVLALQPLGRGLADSRVRTAAI